MRSAELRERVIPVESELISRADAALKGGRPGERAAEYPAWIRNFPSARGLQRAKVDRYSVGPQECRFLHQLAVIPGGDRKSTRLNSSHSQISYAVFCLKKKK